MQLPALDTQVLLQNKLADLRFRERRHPQWTSNYQLYRDTVITNRLTQRQSVNVPLMKATIRTILSGNHELADLYFENLDNDKQKELYFNEYWNDSAEQAKLELVDIVDKKQVLLYGRSTRKLNIVNGRLDVEPIDNFDILFDRYMNPWNTESAKRVTHMGIFRDLDELAANPMYDTKAIQELKIFYGTKAGLIKAADNAQALADKNRRLEEMGATLEDPLIGGTIVEVNEHFVKVWDANAGQFVWMLAPVADQQKLCQLTLKEVMGINFLPFVSWADDIERTDVYSDGWADVVRVPNQVLNAWLSQLVENRTLRNYGMNYYNSSIEGFSPQTFQPSPWGWYPIPAGADGDMSKVFKSVQIPDLSESLDEMKFVIGMVESATAATSVEKGDTPDRQITLGEVKILEAKSQQRIGSISKYSTLAAKELGQKACAILEANTDKLSNVTLYKKSFKGNYFPQEVPPSKWKSKSGYRVKVQSKEDLKNQNIEQIQKMKFAQSEFPNNLPLRKIYERKVMDLIGLTPEESREVTDFEEKQRMGAMQPGMTPGMPGAPTAPGMPGGAPAGTPALPAPTGVTVGDVINQNANVG